MKSSNATDFSSGSAALPVGQPTINNSSEPTNENGIGLDLWVQDLFSDELDFSCDWMSLPPDDATGPQNQEDPNLQVEHASSVFNQHETVNLQLEPGNSHSEQGDGAFNVQKKNNSSSIPEGLDKTFQNEEADSIHAQTHCSFADSSQANFNHFENAWQADNLDKIDLDQFFQAGEYQSTILQSELQHDYQMPPLTEMQQTSRLIRPPLIGMGQPPLPANGMQPRGVGRTPLPGHKMHPPSYGTQPPLYGTQLHPALIGNGMQPASHTANQAVIKTQPPLFGVLGPALDEDGEPIIGVIEWEWWPVSVLEAKNNRSANIEQFDPTQFYYPITKIPQSFGRHKPGELPPFRYNRFGELLTKDKFSSSQIYEYLTYHPLHYSTSGYDPKNSQLILWIQNVPADSYRRYPSKGSDKCRFEDCPALNHTIFKGFFRVAFDEHSTEYPFVDPFHCAGFVHLYCLEKFCDFPSICRTFNVRPDVRRLPEGTNRMAITRDYREMRKVVNDFIASAANKAKAQRHEESLGYLLTMKSLRLEPQRRKVLRKTRHGNTIDDHRGNVTRWVDNGGVNGMGKASYDVDNDINARKCRRSALNEERDVESDIAKKQRLQLEESIHEPAWKLTEVTKRKRNTVDSFGEEREEEQSVSETTKRRKISDVENC